MYTVKKVFGRSELFEKDGFPLIQDARNHIQGELLKDIQMKVNASYRIYDGADLEEELTQRDAKLPPSSSSDAGSSSQQKGGRQVFSPSPLSTTPRPKGIPQNWKEEKDEDDK